MVRKDGRVIDISISSQAVFDDDGNFAGVEGIYRDITQRKNLERELHRMASTDTLTGMANRRVFLERAEAAFQLASTESQPLALLMLDLDHFKQINDRLGHLEGDRVLIAFAQAVQLLLRADDTVGRLGGEEFGVLLPGSGHDGALAIAVRILQHIRDLSLPGPHGQPVQVATSIGLACQLPTIAVCATCWTAQTVRLPSQAPGARPLRLRLSPGDLQSLRQARHALADLVHVGRGERQAQRGVVGVGAEERRAGHKGHALLDGALGQRCHPPPCHPRPSGAPTRTGRPGAARTRSRRPARLRSASPMAWARSAYTRAHGPACRHAAGLEVLRGRGLGEGAGVRVAELLAHGGLGQQLGGAIIQPTRRPGEHLAQAAAVHQLAAAGHLADRASRLGGGASPKYRSP
jgi:diguanylate cyclase (GGDEF)-like protein